jgi:peptidoglycan hydrolase FlgJ
MTVPSVSATPQTSVSPHDAALRKAAKDMEGLFVQQLFKSMRETVPTDGGITDRSQGEDLFTGLMDERVAADTGSRWHRGLSDAIYRALRASTGADSTARQDDPRSRIDARTPDVSLAQLPQDR